MSESRKLTSSVTAPAQTAVDPLDAVKSAGSRPRSAAKTGRTGALASIDPVGAPALQLPLEFVTNDTSSPGVLTANRSWIRKLREEDEANRSDEIEIDASTEARAAEASVLGSSNEILLAQASSGVPATTAADAAAAQGASAGAGGAGAGAGVVAGAMSPAVVVGGLVAGAALIGLSTSSSSPAAPQTPEPSAKDTTAPTLRSVSASSAANSVTLVFDEALNETSALSKNSFSVKVGTATYTPSSVSVKGATVVLGFAETDLKIAKGAFNLQEVKYTPQAGNAQIFDSAGNAASALTFDGSKQGIVADGYIVGAQIYIDVDNDGEAEPSELVPGVVTDADGRFFLPANAPSGTIIAVGGVNTDTGLPNVAPLKAPAGSKTVNPLTTLVQEVASKSGLSAADAATKVAGSLGLSFSTGQSLLNFDPLAAFANATTGSDEAKSALAVQQAAAKVATIVTLASAGSGSGSAASKVVENLAQSILPTPMFLQAP